MKFQLGLQWELFVENLCLCCKFWIVSNMNVSTVIQIGCFRCV